MAEESRAVGRPRTEIQFQFTAEEWEQHKERMSALTTAVYEAWKNSGQ